MVDVDYRNRVDMDNLSYWLDDLIELNIECGNADDIQLIRKCFENEEWSTIVDKYNSDGSTWVCWWNDGVSRLQSSFNRQSYEPRKE